MISIAVVVGGLALVSILLKESFYSLIDYIQASLFFFMPHYPAPPRPANRQGWKAFLAIDYIGTYIVV
jgi:hypothetical protein